MLNLQQFIKDPKKLKEHLLANFCDGDSWENADALSLTKHGALDVAEYFYKLGARVLLEEVIKCIDEMKEDCDKCDANISGNEVLTDLASHLQEEIKKIV